MKKSGQFNFVWLFAILVGGAILVLAIYGAIKTGDTARYRADTEVGKTISILTDPLQAGFAKGSFERITFKQDTRINNFCFSGNFGQNDISVSTRSNIGEEWNLPGGATSIYNKYIFSSEKDTGKVFYVFSKPFEFPYKISDLIFVNSDNYCFKHAPKEIAKEIIAIDMKIKNIEVDDDDYNCTLPNAIEVCFGGATCDIMVTGKPNCNVGADCFDEGTVYKKNGIEMDYVGNLMYAAIFSDKDIYDCNVKRLLYRGARIAEGFAIKGNLMDARGCNTNLQGSLNMWAIQLDSWNIGDDLSKLKHISDNLKNKNEREVLCGVW